MLSRARTHITIITSTVLITSCLWYWNPVGGSTLAITLMSHYWTDAPSPSAPTPTPSPIVTPFQVSEWRPDRQQVPPIRGAISVNYAAPGPALEEQPSAVPVVALEENDPFSTPASRDGVSEPSKAAPPPPDRQPPCGSSDKRERPRDTPTTSESKRGGKSEEVPSPFNSSLLPDAGRDEAEISEDSLLRKAPAVRVDSPSRRTNRADDNLRRRVIMMTAPDVMIRTPFSKDDLANLKENDPEMYELYKDDGELENETNSLVQAYRAMPETNVEKRKMLSAQIHAVITTHFEVRQTRRLLELKRMEAKLEALRKSIEARQKNREEVVNKRVSQLLNENEPDF